MNVEVVKQWEISKYRPPGWKGEEYNEYIQHEWTHFCEIGQKFHGIELTSEEYFQTEQLYLDALFLFIKELEITQMQVKNLVHPLRIVDSVSQEVKHARREWLDFFEQNMRRFQTYYPPDLIELFYHIDRGKWLNRNEISLAVKLALRGHLGIKISKVEQLEVEFSDDYYMYITAWRSCQDSLQQIKDMGLSVLEVEPFSPWEEV